MLSLQELPVEVLSHVCAHLIPSNHTFLVNARATGTPARKSQLDSQVAPRVSGTPLIRENESRPQHPAITFEECGIDIFTILLIHSTIYPHVVECLYANNVFYLPDLATLFYLRSRWSSLAIRSVRTIRVDACGPPTRSIRGYIYFDSWTQLADPDIIRIPELFPGIRELRLGGVGPGLVQRRSFTFRGSRNVRDTEVSDVWTLDNVFLISKIIGISFTEGVDDVMECGDRETADQHALSGGRVFCSRQDHSERWAASRGHHRLHGTRIVRRGEFVEQGVMEQEVVNVRAVLEKAREAHAQLRASGYSEVPPTRDDIDYEHG